MSNLRLSRQPLLIIWTLSIAIASGATVIWAGPATPGSDRELVPARNVKRLVIAPDLASPAITNASQSDTGPHNINEVSMIVTPTYSSLVRDYVTMAWCAYMRYPTTPGTPFTISAAVAIPGSSPGLIPPGAPLKDDQTTFANTGDPVLASNPSTTGYNPRMIYLAGTTWDGMEDQISVWTLSPGFVAQWSMPTRIAHNTDNHFEDKPAIAVSQSDFGSRRGHVYLVYLGTGAGNETIEFYRDLGTGVWEHSWTYTTINNEFMQSPRIDVDANGTIYLSYLDWNNNLVHVQVSTDEGSTWSDHSRSTLNSLLTSNINNNATICNVGGCGVFSPSMLMSGFNNADQSLALVYHRRRLDGTGSEVVMERFVPATSLFSSPVRVSHLDPDTPSANDQWQGAVACGTDGTCVVSYYNNHSSTDGSMQYRVYDRRVKGDGKSIAGEADTVVYDTLSNPNVFTHVGAGGRMEYHDTFFYNNLWYTADVIVSSSTTSDVILTSQ